jgi:hypothetical protein
MTGKRKLMKKIYQMIFIFMNGKYGGVLWAVISEAKKTVSMIISSGQCSYSGNLEKTYHGPFRSQPNQHEKVAIKNTLLHVLVLQEQLI